MGFYRHGRQPYVVKPGSSKLAVRKDGCKPVEMTVQVDKATTVVKELKLECSPTN